MKRETKIKALNEALRGNLVPLGTVIHEERKKVCCLVMIHEGRYRIQSITPHSLSYEKYLNRDLTEQEYNEFKESFSIVSNSIHELIFKNMNHQEVVIFELPDDNRNKIID